MRKEWQRILRGRAAQRFSAVLVGLLIAGAGVLAWTLPGKTQISVGYWVIIVGVAVILIGTASWWLWPKRASQLDSQTLASERASNVDRYREDADRDYLVPRDLPPAPATFVGRSDDMKRLVYGLETHEGDRPFVAVIHGHGGIGKTALALNFAHHIAARFPDGQTFVHVAEWDSALHVDEMVSPAAGTDLAVKIARELFLALRRPGEKIPESPAQLLEQYKRLSTGRRLVIVLDDVPERAALPPFVQLGTRSAIIVTARSEPSAVEADVSLSLEPLNPEAALTLLRQAVGKRDSEEQGEPLRELAYRCNGDPLALTLAGAALAFRPHWKLSLARDLISQGGMYPTAFQTGQPEAESLDATYQLLTTDEQYALRCIGAIGRARFAAWALQATLGDNEGDQTRALASSLTRAGLIERTSTGAGGVPIYEVAEPVVAYARRLADRVDMYRVDAQCALDRLNLQRAERRREKPSLRIRKQVYPRMRAGQLREAIGRARDALALVRDNPDQSAEAACFAALAELYAELGEISAAEDAAYYASKIGEADSRARALRSLAKLQRRARHLAEAEELLNQALRLAREAGDAGEEIRILAERALILCRSGKFDQAKKDSLTSVTMSRHGETGQLPFALLSYGAVSLYEAGSDETDEQLRHTCLTRAQKIFADAYREAESAHGDNSKQFLNMSWIRHAQAKAAIEEEKLAKADEWAREAMMSFADKHHRYGVAHCRLLLGTISLRLNQPREATGELLSALKTFRNCGDTRIVADVSLVLAQAFLELGKRAEARRLQQSAVNSYLQLREQDMAHAAAVALLTNLFGRFRRRPSTTHHVSAAILG